MSLVSTQTVFEHVADALGILVTLDHIFKSGEDGTFGEHWKQYKRIVTSIRGAPTEYGVDENKLKPFEKLLQNLEGKLMEGQMFRVCACVSVCMCDISPSPLCQTCVTQLFDTREVNVSQNQTLSEEFAINLRNIVQYLESRIGET